MKTKGFACISIAAYTQRIPGEEDGIASIASKYVKLVVAEGSNFVAKTEMIKFCQKCVKLAVAYKQRIRSVYAAYKQLTSSPAHEKNQVRDGPEATVPTHFGAPNAGS